MTEHDKITVIYWRGTTQVKSAATTYAKAMLLATKNQNRHGPTFWNQAGEQMHDDGSGLATAADIENNCYSF